jgi:hypothetical protein
LTLICLVVPTGQRARKNPRGRGPEAQKNPLAETSGRGRESCKDGRGITKIAFDRLEDTLPCVRPEALDNITRSIVRTIIVRTIIGIDMKPALAIVGHSIMNLEQQPVAAVFRQFAGALVKLTYNTNHK